MRLLLVLGLLLPLVRAEQIVILGDSLSKEYEFEFQLEGFEDPESVRNWIEILHAERNDRFNMGSRRDIDLVLFEAFFRHKFNWAVPGAKIDQISSFLRGEIEFVDFFPSSDPNPFEEVLNLVLGFITSEDFDLDELDDQVRNKAERAVLFVGGNDTDNIYRELYEGDPSFDGAAWRASFVGEARFILDWVLTRNPDIQFVLVGVPHIGITPKVKGTHPTDPVATGRATTFLHQLNRDLAALAREREVGFADIFESTLPLLGEAPLCIHGQGFANELAPEAGDPGSLDYVWMRGPASDGFHPNTNGQIQIANEILQAFNRRYRSGIPALQADEMLGDWLGRDPEVSFAQWLDCHGLSGADGNDDRDRDGLPAALEFGLGGNPTRAEPGLVRLVPVSENGSPTVEIAYPLRLPGSSSVLVAPESSRNLQEWTPLSAPATPGPDGLHRLRLPPGPEREFLRLRARLP